MLGRVKILFRCRFGYAIAVRSVLLIVSRQRLERRLSVHRDKFLPLVRVPHLQKVNRSVPHFAFRCRLAVVGYRFGHQQVEPNLRVEASKAVAFNGAA
ncbi:hypothetical protein SV7mr_27220 [Stieleria bergensis]|uniref:Uncharacterized protein n=1 Tax=Stieleria bergensis TaxID=2528025 RepID=A0A517SVP8_9BACT|nr:hypothetical protein SV7mr_27220 [Planctomycetes bacterium SV_7m_r]